MTRNRRGRNLVSSNPKNKLAHARYLLLRDADLAGRKRELCDIITQCGSIAQIERIRKTYGLSIIVVNEIN